MANKHRGEIELILDKPRILKYGMNELIILEKEFGLDFVKGDANMELGLSEIRAMIYVGLKHHYPDITIEDAGDLAGYYPLMKLIDQITDVIGFSVGADQKELTSQKKKMLQKAGIGKKPKK